MTALDRVLLAALLVLGAPRRRRPPAYRCSCGAPAVSIRGDQARCLDCVREGRRGAAVERRVRCAPLADGPQARFGKGRWSRSKSTKRGA